MSYFGCVLKESAMVVQAKIVDVVGSAQVLCYGTPFDWATRAIQEEGDQEKAPHLISLLGRIAREYEVSNFFCPAIQFTQDFVGKHYLFPHRLTLPETYAKLCRGLVVEGRVLCPGEAFVVAPADCATVVVSFSNCVLVCHAGLRSLYNPKALNNDSETHSGVIDQMCLWVPREERRYTNVGIFLPISSGVHYQHKFDDSVHGKRNQLLVKYLIRRYGNTCIIGNPPLGQIDLREVICQQLQSNGIPIKNFAATIPNSCPFSSTNQDGSPMWHSNRRDKMNGIKTEPRNLVVVINKAR